MLEQQNEVQHEDTIILNQPYDIRFHAEEMSENLIIMWKYPDKPLCVKGFLIQYSDLGRIDDFQTIISDTESINNFHFLPKIMNGWYRIRALGFFEPEFSRSGPFSVPILF